MDCNSPGPPTQPSGRLSQPSLSSSRRRPYLSVPRPSPDGLLASVSFPLGSATEPFLTRNFRRFPGLEWASVRSSSSRPLLLVLL